MDKLPKEEQEKIRRTSTERLKEGLLKVDYAKEELDKMDRDTLMNTWAQVLLVRAQTQAGAEARGELIRNWSEIGWNLRNINLRWKWKKEKLICSGRLRNEL